jgi:cell fate regulator YaaT (PSP1 superfamily)
MCDDDMFKNVQGDGSPQAPYCSDCPHPVGDPWQDLPDEAGHEAPASERAVAVAVSFDPGQPVVYFRRGNLHVVPGDMVIARLERAVDIGRVTALVYLPADQVATMPSLLRRATETDLRRREEQNAKRRDALAKCAEKIAEHRLPMKLIDCYYTLDGRRLVFYFAAEGRVDFRALVKDLARIFHCRIELRQVGVRDHAKLLGGIGPCGRPLCCAQFLRTFDPVGIKVAKDQGLPLNPAKLSGPCDRLMCCLLFEHETYKRLGEEMPKVGDVVTTPRGAGIVEAVEVLAGRVTVSFPDRVSATFAVADVVSSSRSSTHLTGQQLSAQEAVPEEKEPQTDDRLRSLREKRLASESPPGPHPRPPSGQPQHPSRNSEAAQPTAEGGKTSQPRRRRLRWSTRRNRKNRGE